MRLLTFLMLLPLLAAGCGSAHALTAADVESAALRAGFCLTDEVRAGHVKRTACAKAHAATPAVDPDTAGRQSSKCPVVVTDARFSVFVTICTGSKLAEQAASLDRREGLAHRGIRVRNVAITGLSERRVLALVRALHHA